VRPVAALNINYSPPDRGHFAHHPNLREHLEAVLAMMKLSDN